MSEHPKSEALTRLADGEIVDAAVASHVRGCEDCSARVIAEVQTRRAVREAMLRVAPPSALRERVARSVRPRRLYPVWWLAAAAAVALLLLSDFYVRSATVTRELIDMHATILAGSNPIDVVSTDRHTVKPWFEGRVPFAVAVPDLPPPFRLIGGRVIFWRRQPGAYLLIGKGNHRISMFVFPSDVVPSLMPVATQRDTTFEVWEHGGLTYVVVADIPAVDLGGIRASVMR